MVKPNQPKGIKPKAEMAEVPVPEVKSSGVGLDLSGQKLIIVNTIITVVICTLFISGNYLIVNGVVESKLSNLSQLTAIHGNEDAAEHGEEHEKGIILDLGEFILNLSDPSGKRYLKVNVALELSKAAHDPTFLSINKVGGHGGSGSYGGDGYGGGGSSAPKEEDPLAIIEKEMKQYKPAIRDAIISVLSTKTVEELSSLAGKELAKEQIKDAVDPIFRGEREVLRVSFGSFIIQ